MDAHNQSSVSRQRAAFAGGHAQQNAASTQRPIDEILVRAGVSPLGREWIRNLRQERAIESSREKEGFPFQAPVDQVSEIQRMLQFEKSFSHVCLGIGRLLSSNILELYRNVKIDGVVLADGVGRNAVTIRRPVDAVVIESSCVYFLEFVHSWELESSPLFEWIGGHWRSRRIDAAAARLGIGYRLIAWDEVAAEEMRSTMRFPGICGETNEVEARSSLFDSVAVEAAVKRRRIVDWEDLRSDGYTDEAIEHAILLGLVYYPRHDPAFVFFEGDAKSLYCDRSTYLKSLS